MIEFLEKALKFLLDLQLYIPRKIFELVTDAIAGLASSIPAPDFIANASAAFAAMPASVIWLAAFFKIGTGITIILGAYLLRFGLKFIPTLGF